jgi:hypothetical protein
VPERAVELLRNARCDRACSNAPRLRVADKTVDTTPELETDLRQLRRFARAGLAAHDDDLVLGDCTRNLRAPCDDRQLLGVSRLRQVRDAPYRIDLHVPNATKKRPARAGLSLTHD